MTTLIVSILVVLGVILGCTAGHSGRTDRKLVENPTHLAQLVTVPEPTYAGGAALFGLLLLLKKRG